MRRPLRFVLVGSFFWLVVGLACNLPVATPTPGGLSGQQLQQTLDALPFSGTPLPAIPEKTPVAAVPTLNLLDQGTPLATPQGSDLIPPTGTVYYITRPGDTLPALAGRFGVKPEQILSSLPIPAAGYLKPGQHLYIPGVTDPVTPPGLLLPDSELVYSPTAVDFDVTVFIQQAGGFLSTYTEVVYGETLSGAQIVQRVADELSVNPRLLLAFLEYRSRWVSGYPSPGESLGYPIGFEISGREGLYQELVITATQLNMVYYGWRKGNYILIDFPEQVVRRLNPRLNAATASLQNLLAIFYEETDWYLRLYGEVNFMTFYAGMFGDPWPRDALLGALLPVDLVQPPLELPFRPGETWRFSGGPHNTWNFGTPRGALDFSPLGGTGVCGISSLWVTASASGLVDRAAYNAVVLDLDGDGIEQTGWSLLYYHLAKEGMIATGTPVQVNDPLGHPSCEGGRATGAHVHVARKYNGEWLPADDSVPFALSGYQVVAGELNYQGTLVRDGSSIPANSYGSQTALVTR